MRPVLTALLMATGIALPAGGSVAAQTAASEVGPVRSERFGASRLPSPLPVDATALGIHARWPEGRPFDSDSVPAHTAGSFPASAGLGILGGLGGLVGGGIGPDGGVALFVGPVLGAAFGAMAGDRRTGGVHPSFAGALLGAIVGVAAGVAPCLTGSFCQGPPFTALFGVGIGAATGIAVARKWAGRGSNPRPLD